MRMWKEPVSAQNNPLVILGTMMIVAAVLGAVTLCSPDCRAQPSPAMRSALSTPERLVAGIRSLLPAGWSAAWDAPAQWITVTRAEATIMVGGLNAPDAGNPSMDDYQIVLRIGEPVTPEQYKRWAADNARITARLSEMQEGMRSISRKFDSFLPRTPEEKQRVREYEAVKHTLHRLPDYYYGDISLDYLFPRYRGPRDQQVAEECERVKRAVLELLTKDEPQRQLDWEPWTWR